MGEDSPLKPIEQIRDISLGLDEQLWGTAVRPGDRQAFLKAVDRSLQYLKTASAAKAYQKFAIPGITRDRVRRSLLRFRTLLLQSRTPAQLQAAITREFVWYQAAGTDGQGTVHFTGYFEPVFAASRRPNAQYRYPLYRKPADFEQWSKPHPARVKLEGEDGLGKNTLLEGQELVWLRDRLDAYLVQVQGSAKLRLPSGQLMTVGYAGNTDYPYTSLGRELVNDGIFSLEELTLPLLIEYFRSHPQALNQYVPRNNRFIFFQETHGAPPTGSLGIPVTAERSIATDKSLMPPGALALLRTSIPYPMPSGQLEASPVSRYVLDQDTGSAIKGAGRVDIFMGSGKLAGDRAGLINHSGELYYLLLK
jgi:membrane-bound lytic murein transglycosylase A